MPQLPQNVNPVPAVTDEGLAALSYLKGQLRELKEEAFPGGNAYREGGPSNKKTPKGMTRRGLETRIDNILDDSVRFQLAQESAETRFRLEQELGRTVMEKSFPSWMPRNAGVMYSLRVEGRNAREMSDSDKGSGNHWGYKKKQTPIAVLPASEWPGAWRDVVFLDHKVDTTDMTPYMPSDADYLLTSVHKFDVVERAEGNNDIYLDGVRWRPACDSPSIHWRIKSGPEMLWKMVAYLSGIEEKPGETREDIVDEAGARLLVSAGEFGRRFASLHQKLAQGHGLPSLVGSVILQTVQYNGIKPEEQVGEFLESLPNKLRSFYRKTISQENRSITISDDAHVLPRYLEMLTRLGTENGDAFQRNVIDTLVYPNDLFNAMYREEGFDQLAYKARNDGWRTEHYTLFEWTLAAKLAPVLLTGTSLDYVNDLIDARMRNTKLVSARE